MAIIFVGDAIGKMSRKMKVGSIPISGPGRVTRSRRHELDDVRCTSD